MALFKNSEKRKWRDSLNTIHNMEDIYFRTAEEKDVPTLLELERLCFSDPWSEDLIRDDVVKNPISSYLVGEIEVQGIRTIVAYLGIWVVRNECQINNMAVHPDYRGRGIGKRILTEVLEITQELGVVYWTLEVRKGNGPAVLLYKSAGFKEDGIRPNYYENGEDALLMSKEIS